MKSTLIPTLASFLTGLTVATAMSIPRAPINANGTAIMNGTDAVECTGATKGTAALDGTDVVYTTLANPAIECTAVTNGTAATNGTVPTNTTLEGVDTPRFDPDALTWVAPPSEACDSAFTYHHVRNFPWGDPGFKYQAASTSSGELCCRLCHFSMDNCVFAKWDHHDDRCSMMINHGVEKRNGTAEVKEPTESCPNGRLGAGELVNDGVVVGDWSQGLIKGPCF